MANNNNNNRNTGLFAAGIAAAGAWFLYNQFANTERPMQQTTGRRNTQDSSPYPSPHWGIESNQNTNTYGRHQLALGETRQNAGTYQESILVVDTIKDCDAAITRIKADCANYPVLGFDCEWVQRNPVALLQLATYNRFCVLFRLNKLNGIPLSLQTLLSDSSILKVGVAPLNDAEKLDCKVLSTLDLRFLAKKNNFPGESLEKMAKKHLDKTMNKSYDIVCSDWEADTLEEDQITYAADDAFVSIRLFQKFYNKDIQYVKSYCHLYLDKHFTA